MPMIPFLPLIVIADKPPSILAVEQRVFQLVAAAWNGSWHLIDLDFECRTVVKSTFLVEIRLAPWHPHSLGHQPGTVTCCTMAYILLWRQQPYVILSHMFAPMVFLGFQNSREMEMEAAAGGMTTAPRRQKKRLARASRDSITRWA